MIDFLAGPFAGTQIAPGVAILIGTIFLNLGAGVLILLCSWVGKWHG